MDVIISNSNRRPIYEQIYTQIKNQIISGALKTDEMLPSIRSLAKDLRISVITTKRAYDELERDGYIYTIPAKGSFVARTNTDRIREEYLRRIEEHMREIRSLSEISGISESRIFELYRLIEEEYE